MLSRVRRSVTVVAAIVVIGAGVVAVADALPGPVGAARLVRVRASLVPGSVGGRSKTVAVREWWLLGTGPRARSLLIEYPQGDECSSPAGATVRESQTMIRIVLRQRVYLPRAGEACTDELAISRLTVSLRSAVAGRHVIQPGRARAAQSVGRPSVGYLVDRMLGPPYSDVLVPLVPGVIGLSPADATRVLRQEGFHVILRGHRTAVTDQSPRREEVATGTDAQYPSAGVVHLLARPTPR
jgi:hypothetical protein